MSSLPEWVTIARILGARGNKGEVAALSLSSYPERFESLQQVFVDLPGGSRREFEVERIWNHKDRLIFKFSGVDSIGAAETLARGEIQIPRDRRWQTAAGEFYHSDLIGCEVVERAGGRSLGRVVDIEEYGGPALLAVSAGEDQAEPLLIPFVGAICISIRPEDRRIEVDLPEGLIDLPQGAAGARAEGGGEAL